MTPESQHIIIKDFPQDGMDLEILPNDEGKVPMGMKLLAIIEDIISQIPKFKSRN